MGQKSRKKLLKLVKSVCFVDLGPVFLNFFGKIFNTALEFEIVPKNDVNGPKNAKKVFKTC